MWSRLTANEFVLMAHLDSVLVVNVLSWFSLRSWEKLGVFVMYLSVFQCVS